MEDINQKCISSQEKTSSEDLHWFFAKSKVPISLAITECKPFLDRFIEVAVLSEEESLELQADTRSVHRVIYECLCWIEEKNFPLEYFFDNLFQKTFLKSYPKLNPIYNDYRKGKYKSDVQTSTDKDQDQAIFAQDKVKICLAVTDLFPFIHGLQDLTILSELESLKLQADGRPVSRVIYECLSLIEKKDLHFGVVFEYIFQPCYQTLYPGLQAILQESNMDQAGPFNGKQYLEFNNRDSLVEFYEHNKPSIANAINECFPFLNGLHDMGLLTKLELLKLLADKRSPSEVLHEALSWIQQRDYLEPFFTYVFRDFYLSRFPDLNTILYRLNKAIVLDMCLPIPDRSPLILEAKRDLRLQSNGTRNQDLTCLNDVPPPEPKEKKDLKMPQNQTKNRDLKSLDDVKDLMVESTRKCRLKPICYTEPSDNDLELIGDRKSHAGVKSSLQQKLKQERQKETKPQIPIDGLWDVTMEQEQIKDTANVAVKLEFPKQVFNDVFNVRCGHKKGIFMKEHWKGDPSNDSCISCDKKMFTVIKFEKYGGRQASKNWKKSIRCAGIMIEELFLSGILKPPRKLKRQLSL